MVLRLHLVHVLSLFTFYFAPICHQRCADRDSNPVYTDNEIPGQEWVH